MADNQSSPSFSEAPGIAQYAQNQNNPLIEHQYKSYKKLFGIAINAALSSFFIGYSLVCIGAIQFSYIIQIYGLENWDPNVAESVVNGAVPIGAMGGALLSSQIISRISRRNGFLLTNIVGVLCLFLIFIKTSVTLLIGRFLQGICTGIFSSIVPLYINQMVTPDATNLGSLNQVLISSAQGFCFLWYFILVKIFKNQDGTFDHAMIWNLVALFPIIPIVIQTILFILIFPYNTPKHLYNQGRHRQASEMIAKIYKQQFVDDAIARLGGGVSSSSVHSDNDKKIGIKQQLTGIPGVSKFQNNKIAIFFAIHLALLQQMDGVNAIVVYGKQTLNDIIKDNQDLIDLSQVLITSLPAVMAAFSIKLLKKKGRKFLIQMGTIAVIICLSVVIAAIIVSNEEKNIISSICVISAMAIYMSFFGLTLGPIVWLYIPEIVQPNILPFSTMVNLSGAAFCIIVFPLIKGSNIITFSIFLAWSLIALVINAKFMVQTKDKSRRKIFDEYKQLKLF